MKFYFVHIVQVCFVFKKHCAYIPLYMRKTFPALGSQKEQ